MSPLPVSLSLPGRAAALALLVFCACQKPASPTTLVDGDAEKPFSNDALRGARSVDVSFDGDGRLRLLAARANTTATAGQKTTLTLYWLVERALTKAPPQVFVHLRQEHAELNQAQADHALPAHPRRGDSLRPGDVVVDRFDVVVPRGVDGPLVVRAGLYEKKTRWQTSPKSDDDAVVVASFDVAGAFAAAVADVARVDEGAVVVDGVLDDAAWQKATPLSLRHYAGRDGPLLPTTAKLLWSTDALYLAFDAKDDDVFSPYDKRDDPLYESEAYEIFVDADGDGAESSGEYVELQSNAKDVHFDAAFSGGRRKNMETGYDVPFTTKSVVQGDRVTQEWRIPVAALRGVPPGEPRAGATWRINLFRLERRRRGQKVVATEASAWSPPLSNDFHNVRRFGAVRFVE